MAESELEFGPGEVGGSLLPASSAVDDSARARLIYEN